MAAFRILSFLIGFIPLWFGVNGLLFGAAEHMGGDAFTTAMDNQYRYLSGGYIGVALMIFYSAGEIRKRAMLFRFAMLFFFIGGCARAVSYLTVGQPPTEQFAGMIVELLSPLLLLWQAKVLRY
jgi:ABC-type transport system involved in multi-copper enzyme maturation permease subunit